MPFPYSPTFTAYEAKADVELKTHFFGSQVSNARGPSRNKTFIKGLLPSRELTGILFPRHFEDGYVRFFGG